MAAKVNPGGLQVPTGGESLKRGKETGVGGGGALTGRQVAPCTAQAGAPGGGGGGLPPRLPLPPTSIAPDRAEVRGHHRDPVVWAFSEHVPGHGAQRL